MQQKTTILYKTSHGTIRDIEMGQCILTRDFISRPDPKG